MISAGAKKDLLVLQFCLALIQISKTDEVFADDDVIDRASNKDYHVNKRIDKALEVLKGRMAKTVSVIINREGYSLSLWLKRALDSKVLPALNSIQANTINLEMLSVWVMYVTMCEREKPLADEFKEYEDAEQYFKIIQLMENVEIAKLESVLFGEAYRIRDMIKS